MSEVELIVVQLLPEFGFAYTDSADRRRCPIDRDTKIESEVKVGRVLRAQVLERGYVVSAIQTRLNVLTVLSTWWFRRV